MVGYGDIWVEDDALTLLLLGTGAVPRLGGAGGARARRHDAGDLPAGHEVEEHRRSPRLPPRALVVHDGVELIATPRRPAAPDGLTLRAYRGDEDSEAVRLALNEAFADDWHHHDIPRSELHRV